MKHNSKKLSILAVGVLLGLVACGGTEATTPTPTTPEPTTVVPTTPTPTTPEVTTPEVTTPEVTTPEVTTPAPTPTTPTPDPVGDFDIDIRIEAEDGVLAKEKLQILDGAGASNGKVAAGIDDCGQGLYFIHYAPVGGEHDIEIGYFTPHANSKHELVVNGAAQTVVYENANDWSYTGCQPEKATVKAELIQGYNVITLSKKGTIEDSPEYGGWVQVDYLEIKGTGVEYNKDLLTYDLDSIKVEAELGSYHSGEGCPVGMAEASNGYIVGGINAAGEGADYALTLPAGKYALQIAYGKDGGARPIDIKFDETNYTYNLEDYAGQAWNVFNLSGTAAILEFTGAEHTLSITRAENSNWFCFDYFVLTKVAETKDVKIEAEDCIIDGNRTKVAENEMASGGLMACDMNDCGQGLYFPFFAQVAGEYDMDIAYWTGAAGSKQDVYVNGAYQATVVYDQNTGWADGSNESATATTKITLKAGYNDITVIKYGVASDSPEYGGWVQVDCFLIKGGKEYNPNVNVDRSLSMRIEAELGNYNSGSSCPVGMAEGCNGYIVGEINAEGHGSTFKIRVPETGTYQLQIVYGKDGGARPLDIVLDETAYTYSLEDYDGQAWNVFHTSNVAATLELNSEVVHTLSITRAAGSNWFCFDSIILTKVA